MSRLAKKSIEIISGVTIQENDRGVLIKGPKGEERVALLPKVKVSQEGNALRVTTDSTDKEGRMNTGTMWSLLRNGIQGVTQGFEKVLEIEGIGFRASLEGSVLVLFLGYAHPVRFTPSPGITIQVEKNSIKISGVSKDLVGRTAAEIRALKKPEPYKGKGIRYQGEVIKMKVGKKATATAG